MDSHEHLLQQRDERIRELERQNEEMRRVVVEMVRASLPLPMTAVRTCPHDPPLLVSLENTASRC